jgi:hypothetical protein
MILIIFNLQGEKNNQTYNVYTILQGFMTFLFAVPLNMVLLELLGMWLVLVGTGPLCPQARSILIFVRIFSLVGVFIDLPSLYFQWELLGLAT